MEKELNEFYDRAYNKGFLHCVGLLEAAAAGKEITPELIQALKEHIDKSTQSAPQYEANRLIKDKQISA